MRAEEIKSWYLRYIDEVWNQGDLEAVVDYWHPQVSDQHAPSAPTGIEGMKRYVEPWFTGFSNRRYTVEDLIVEGDRIAARILITGTHTGEFMGLPPSGKRFAIREIVWYRLQDGRIIDIWPVADLHGLLGLLTGEYQLEELA